MYEKFGGSKWSFSWLGQKVNIAIAGVALTGGDDFDPRRIRANCHVISVTDVTRKISVLATN